MRPRVAHFLPAYLRLKIAVPSKTRTPKSGAGLPGASQVVVPEARGAKRPVYQSKYTHGPY